MLHIFPSFQEITWLLGYFLDANFFFFSSLPILSYSCFSYKNAKWTNQWVNTVFSNDRRILYLYTFMLSMFTFSLLFICLKNFCLVPLHIFLWPGEGGRISTWLIKEANKVKLRQGIPKSPPYSIQYTANMKVNQLSCSHVFPKLYIGLNPYLSKPFTKH